MNAYVKICLSVLAVALIAVSCNVSNPTTPGNKSNTIVDTAIGGNIYRAGCASCHGDSAQGTPSVPVNIMGISGIHGLVINGMGAMPRFKTLSDSDVKSVELFIGQFKLKGLDTMTGVQVYHQFCATCHGDSAQGITGMGVGIQGDSANVKTYVRNGGKLMPVFNFVTDRQLNDIKLYLASFTLPTDGAGLYKIFCSSCHGDQAQGLPGKGVSIQGDTGNVYNFVRNGGTTMQKFTSITDTQIDSIKSFLGTFIVPQDGPGLYKMYCATCHGDSAQGLAGLGVGIQGDTANVTSFVRNGGKTMPMIKSLSDGQIVLIKNFLATFIIPTDGPGLYKLYCASCHGANAEGIAGSGVAIQGDSANVTTFVTNGGKTMPKFSQLNAAQIYQIKVFLGSFSMPQDGAGLFKLYCSHCHGDSAQGIISLGPGIQGDTANVTKYVTTGGKTMPKIQSLSAAQIVMIKQYLAAFMIPTDGPSLFKLYCASCHGNNAEGVMNSGVALQGDSLYVETMVRNGGKTMPKFASLTAAQITQIKLYLGSFTLPSDGNGLYNLYCKSCHGANAQGISGSGVGIQGDTGNVATFVRFGGTTMPKFLSITNPQIASIKQYLGSFILPTDGAGIFKVFCSSCHGVNAEGITGSGPAIQGDTANVTNYVHNGGKTMPKQSSVTDAQIVQIKNFLATFLIPKDGPGLFKLYCGSCHGDQAQGVINSGIAIQGDTANVSNFLTNGGKTMPKFSSLNATQVTAIKNYLAAFTLPTTSPGFYRLYCSLCHGDQAQGISGSGVAIQGDTANVTPFVRFGGKTMPRFYSLGDPQINYIKQFLVSFVIPTDGAGLYKLYCASCHGTTAQGITGSGPGIQGDTGNVTNFVTNGGKTMPKQLQLNAAQIVLVKQYLGSFIIPTDGPGLFKLYCASCHGDSAQGITGSGPGIQRDTGNVTNYVTNGGKTMPKQSQVNAAQIAAIKSFLISFPAPLDGAGIYKLKCAACHGDTAQGITGKAPGIQRDTANVTNYVTNGGITMPKQSLTPAEIILVKNYLMTFAPPLDGPSIFKLYCASCHGDSAQGISGKAPGIQRDTANVTNYVTNGGITMPKQSLTPPQIILVKNYLMTFAPPADGATIFKMYCSTCHGDTAQGIAGKGPGIQRDTGNVTNYVTNGGTTMPKQSLSPSQIVLVKNYLMTFAAQTTGAGLFAMYCVSCHGTNGQGLVGGGPGIQQDTTNLASIIHNGGKRMPAISAVDTSGVTLLANFLMTLPMPTDGAGLYSRNCATCHGTDAMGDSVTYVGLAGGHGPVWTAVSSGYKPRAKSLPTMPSLPRVNHTQADSVTSFLQGVTFTHSPKNLWIVNCMYCHGTKVGADDYNTITKFTKLIQTGNSDGMPAGTWLTQSDADSLYYYVTH